MEQDPSSSSRVCFLQSKIAELKNEEEKAHKRQAARIDILVKMRKCYDLQLKFETAECDFGDLRDCMETFITDLSKVKEKLSTEEGSGDSEMVSMTSLEREIREVKCSFEKLCFNEEFKVSTLLEKAYAGTLKSKEIEVEECNKLICKLQQKLLVLQTSLDEKNEMITELNSRHAQEAEQANEKIAQVEHVMEIVRSMAKEKDEAKKAAGKFQHDLQVLEMSLNEKDGMIAVVKSRHESEMMRHTQAIEQANEMIKQLQLDMEELRSLCIEKDKTIAKLTSELSKPEMDSFSCTIGKDDISKEHCETAFAAPSKCVRRAFSRKRKSEAVKQVTNQKRRYKYGDTSELQASIPVTLINLEAAPDVKMKLEKPTVDRRRHYEGMSKLNDRERHKIETFLRTPMTSNQLISDREGSLVTRQMLLDVLFRKKVKGDVIDSYAQLFKMKAERFPDRLHQCVYITPIFWYLFKLGRTASALKIVNQIPEEDFETASMIICPISSHEHWYLVICNLIDGRFELMSSIESEQFKMNAKEFVNWMKNFLSTKLKSSDPEHWPLHFDKKCPQQQNIVDCGIFVMAYMHFVWHRETLELSQNDIPLCRGLFAYQLLKGEIE